MDQNAAPNTIRGSKVDLLSTKVIDMKGRKVTGAADATEPTDYVTLKQQNKLSSDFNTQVQDSIKKFTTALNSSLLTLGVTGGRIAFFTTNTALAVVKQILSAYTSATRGSAYTGIVSGVAGTPYAQVNDLNNLRIAYENLRVMCEDLRTKLQNSTFVG